MLLLIEQSWNAYEADCLQYLINEEDRNEK
jgi:hypothetical protein